MHVTSPTILNNSMFMTTIFNESALGQNILKSIIVIMVQNKITISTFNSCQVGTCSWSYWWTSEHRTWNIRAEGSAIASGTCRECSLPTLPPRDLCCRKRHFGRKTSYPDVARTRSLRCWASDSRRCETKELRSKKMSSMILTRKQKQRECKQPGMKRISPGSRMHSWWVTLANSGYWERSGFSMSITCDLSPVW